MLRLFHIVYGVLSVVGTDFFTSTISTLFSSCRASKNASTICRFSSRIGTVAFASFSTSSQFEYIDSDKVSLPST